MDQARGGHVAIGVAERLLAARRELDRDEGGAVPLEGAVRLVLVGRDLVGRDRDGELPGKRLLDSSSGNTAISYAMFGAALGFGVTICLPGSASVERKGILRAYGAEVIETDPLEGSDGALVLARAMAAREPERFFYADQRIGQTSRALVDATNATIRSLESSLASLQVDIGFANRLALGR